MSSTTSAVTVTVPPFEGSVAGLMWAFVTTGGKSSAAAGVVSRSSGANIATRVVAIQRRLLAQAVLDPNVPSLRPQTRRSGVLYQPSSNPSDSPSQDAESLACGARRD